MPISQAGAFIYWIEYDGPNGERVKGRSGYFNVDPILKTKARTPILGDDQTVLPPEKGALLKDEYVNLPLNGLSVLTVVSKWMGPLDVWKQHFREAKERGYTMLHYTPLQERGESDSPYSIRNQMSYDPDLFGGHRVGEEEGTKKVEEILRVAREDYGLLGLTDVVLNHTANDTAWLREHPEAGSSPRQCLRLILTRYIGYSPANTPHLSPALELDTAILNFSEKLVEKGLPTKITSAKDLDIIIAELEKVVRGLDLWQYYVLDPAFEKAATESALSARNAEVWKGPDVKGKSVAELADIFRATKKIKGLGQFASRYGVHVDGNVAAGFVKAAYAGSDVKSNEALASAWQKVVNVLNVDLYKEWEEDTKVAIDQVKNRAKYLRLEENGPKGGAISKEYRLI